MQVLNTLVAYATPLIPRALVHKISRRYIAGDNLADAVVRIRELNAQGFCVTVDVLGETVSSLAQVKDTEDEYVRVLEAIQGHGLRATISVKPSALGLLLDMPHCGQVLERLAETARLHGTAVCIDMEDVRCTQKEIHLFTRLKSRHRNVSLALQAYLKRTYEDMEPLLSEEGNLRICKGIYREEDTHLVDGALIDRSAINPHFLHHVSRCFETGTFVGIATHDAVLIEQVIALARQRGVDEEKFEFQMLLGVCEPLRDRLRDMGYSVRIYVPYGGDWYGYSVRRMKENPQIAGYVLRSMLGR
jgi:proline dehydrogenase